jgi:hypothetical protein
MAEYRVFTIGRDAQFLSYRKFTCKDDADAIIWAKHLIDGYPVELWSGERLVTRLKPKPSMMPKARQEAPTPLR